MVLIIRAIHPQTGLKTLMVSFILKLCIQTHLNKDMAAHNSTYPKGGVSCSKDSFAVNQTLVFQIMFCGKSPALRVAASRQVVKKPNFNI
jgi:hypothetical protein